MRKVIISQASLAEATKLLAEFRKCIEQRDAGGLALGLEVFALAKSSGSNELIFKSCIALSQFYSDTKSEFANSVQTLEEGIALLDDKEDTEDKAELLRLLGLNFDYMGELIKSKQSYDSSILLLRSLPQLGDKAKYTMARSQFNLSIIYSKLMLPALAEECLQSSFEQYNLLNDKAGIARCYISFGVNLEERGGDRLKVLEHYQNAAALSKEINDNISYCVALGNMAVKLAEIGKFEDALEAAFNALEKARKSANKRFQLNLYRQIGRCYHLKKDFENAELYFRAGEEVFLELGLTVDYYYLYRFWAEMLFDAGELREAYVKLQKSITQQAEMQEFHKNAVVGHATLRLQIEEGKKEQELLKRKNAEIEQYARKLEASNFELKQFAHVASHEIKEPLRTISNYSQLLIRSAATNNNMLPEQSEYLNFTAGGAKRIVEVINSMLRLSEITAVEVKETVDLNKTLNYAIEQLADYIESKNARVHSTDLPTITGDGVLMTQLFLNLVSNGIKYNLNVSPLIQINYRDNDDGHYFEVADNGIGIAKEYREKVFIVFQRLHARNEFEGTGLGLTICKKIIDILNGRIWIEDSQLGGTKICFTIPK